MKKIFLVIITFFLLISVNALELNSKYVYVYNDTLDKVMYELNAYEEVKVASMTKIMTAILVIENNENLDRKIIIKDEDLRDMYEYTTTGFQAGHEVTIKELLYGILLRSGADAVNAAVRVTTETEDEFIDLMNQKVKELNLKNTYFSNPVGKDKDNYSSVHDIAKIMEYCIKNETFKEIISTPMHYIDRLNIQINGPLYKKDRKYNLDLSLISGSKSGYTSLAKHSLVSYGEKDGITYIVVTDYANTYKQLLEDNSKIYDYFLNNYGYKNYNTSFDIPIENSSQEKYTVEINSSLYLKNDYDESLITYKYIGKDKITYLNKKGSKLGEILIYYDNELINTLNVNLNDDIVYETKVYLTPNLFEITGIILFILFNLFALNKYIKNVKEKNKLKVKHNKISIINNKEEIQSIQSITLQENSSQKKIEILENTLDINLFFDTMKSIDNVDIKSLERNFIDRCFQNINFQNIEDLKDLYTKLKLYNNDMSNETIGYYNTLFKYCIENHVDKN